jgi:hypothetical protein
VPLLSLNRQTRAWNPVEKHNKEKTEQNDDTNEVIMLYHMACQWNNITNTNFFANPHQLIME